MNKRHVIVGLVVVVLLVIAAPAPAYVVCDVVFHCPQVVYVAGLHGAQ